MEKSEQKIKSFDRLISGIVLSSRFGPKPLSITEHTWDEDAYEITDLSEENTECGEEGLHYKILFNRNDETVKFTTLSDFKGKSEDESVLLQKFAEYVTTHYKDESSVEVMTEGSNYSLVLSGHFDFIFQFLHNYKLLLYRFKKNVLDWEVAEKWEEIVAIRPITVLENVLSPLKKGMPFELHVVGAFEAKKPYNMGSDHIFRKGVYLVEKDTNRLYYLHENHVVEENLYLETIERFGEKFEKTSKDEEFSYGKASFRKLSIGEIRTSVSGKKLYHVPSRAFWDEKSNTPDSYFKELKKAI